jgi:uncharacterized protein (DUF1800 family)
MTKLAHPARRFSTRNSTPFWIAAALAGAAMLAAGFWPGASLAASPAAAARKDKADASKNFKGRLPITELSEDEAILHALNRLGYGPRPGDMDRVRKIGLEKWIDLQLHPESLADSALAARMETYPALAMSPAMLLAEYPAPEMAARRMKINIADYRKQYDDRAKQVGPANVNLPGFGERSPQRILAELSMAKLLRAIYSERQLQEQMTDFWFNHFNVLFYKDADRWLIPAYERDALRANAFGKFRDLLFATAKGPAMLFYLDNWLSADPNSPQRLKEHPERNRPKPGQAPLPALGGKRGLNENYGRELLELHTVGVDGGYNQKDVTEAARCFTGWTLRGMGENPEFYFDDRIHDPDAKKVMGKKIHAGGSKDAEELLKMLAKHPNTAKFISTKLARHFVSDQPPAPLVAAMAKTFRKSDGDIRAVLRTMIYAPEFWSRQAYRAKIKTPFELVASAARALNLDVDSPMPLVQWIARIGEPLYQCQPPTGYADTAAAWVNSGALLNRLNFAVTLASNRLRGAHVELEALLGADLASNPNAALDRAVGEFLAGQVSAETRATLEKEAHDPQVLRAALDDPVQRADLGILTGLVLGSPEFQRR